MQTFIYKYVLEKLKNEEQKLHLMVDGRYEHFLAHALKNPLAMNEMRTMKDNNYIPFREMLSHFTGSPVLRLIKENQEKLELDPDVFDLVYEGFWDLYSFHPQCSDVSAKKLTAWITKINLEVRPGTEVPEGADGDEQPPAEGEEGESPRPAGPRIVTRGEDLIKPINALVRIKVPKVPKEPELDEEGNEIPDETPESDLEDQPFEDKCLKFNCVSEDQSIWVINDCVDRAFRADIAKEFKESIDRLENIDQGDFNFRLEKEAANFLSKFMALFTDDPSNTSNAPKVPVFEFRPAIL